MYKALQSSNQGRLSRAQQTIKKGFVLAFFITKSSRNSLKFVCLSLSLLMHRMLSAATSPGTLRPINPFSILLNLEKDLSPEQLL